MPSDHVIDWGFVAKLMQIAESANPPEYCDVDAGDVELPASDGWRVVFFYDGGELDCISRFITPDGRTIDYFKWPNRYDRMLRALMNWRSVGDFARLQPLLHD